MNNSRYFQFRSSEMILRDHLAIERTAMANERTLLAYVRTMIGLIAVGATLLKLFSGWFYWLVGLTMIMFGAFTLLIGFIRYAKIEVLLTNMIEQEYTRDHGDWMHQVMRLFIKKLHLAKLGA